MEAGECRAGDVVGRRAGCEPPLDIPIDPYAGRCLLLRSTGEGFVTGKVNGGRHAGRGREPAPFDPIGACSRCIESAKSPARLDPAPLNAIRTTYIAIPWSRLMDGALDLGFFEGAGSPTLPYRPLGVSPTSAVTSYPQLSAARKNCAISQAFPEKSLRKRLKPGFRDASACKHSPNRCIISYRTANASRLFPWTCRRRATTLSCSMKPSIC